MTASPPVGGLFGLPWLSLASVFGGVTSGAVMVALVKAWPLLAKLSIEARATLRKERSDAVAAAQARMDAMEARLAAGEDRTHKVELRLVSALTAVTILATELQRLAPRSAALRQAQRLLLAAYPIEDEMPAFIADILKPLEGVE